MSSLSSKFNRLRHRFTGDNHSGEKHKKLLKLKKAHAGKNNRMSMMLSLAGLALIIVGGIGAVALQDRLQTSQDLRQQASVADGEVMVSVDSISNQELGTEQTYNLLVDTNDVETDGVQVVFNLVTDVISTPPTVIADETTGLQEFVINVEDATDGYLISIVMIPDGVAQPFSSSAPVRFAQVVFTPEATGSLTFSFDPDHSHAPQHNSDPTVDELEHVEDATFTITDAGTASPSPTSTASPSPTATPSPTPTATPNATATPTPTPTATPGTGGTTYLQCNDSCTTSHECDANLRCYNNRCRLVTNVSSSSCQQPEIARGCNEYCADTSECGSGFICHFNQCRNPYNVENTACRPPTQSVVTSCNTACSSNDDCAPNTFCYGPTNTCRLATNPSSSVCAASTTKTVSSLYNSESKGYQRDQANATPTPTPGTATSSAGVSPSPSATPNVIYPDQPEPADNAFLEVINQIRAFISSALGGQSPIWPVIMLGVGLLIILFAIVSSIIGLATGGSRRARAGTIPQEDLESTTPPPSNLQQLRSARANSTQPATRSIPNVPQNRSTASSVPTSANYGSSSAPTPSSPSMNASYGNTPTPSTTTPSSYPSSTAQPQQTAYATPHPSSATQYGTPGQSGQTSGTPSTTSYYQQNQTQAGSNTPSSSDSSNQN